MIHDMALVSEACAIGEGTRVWAFANVQAGAVIGKRCNICDGCYIEKGALIGNDVTIKHHVAVFDGVTIKDGAFIGSNVAFINDRRPKSRDKSWVLEKTIIGEGASIGSNSVIMCGLNIGNNAMIGAGSVVTRDVAAHVLLYGNPAEVRGYVCECGRKLDVNLACGCGKRFRLDPRGIELIEE